MVISRRDLVMRAAGASLGAALILGLPLLAAGDEEKVTAPAEKPPEFLRAALAEMKRTASVGVAIVVPDGAKERAALAAAVAGLLQQPSYDVQEHLVEAIWVCVPAKWVDAKSGETAVLLDAEGRRVAGAAVDFSSQKAFVQGAAALLRGEKRLEERAKAARTKEVAAHLTRLAGKDATWGEATVPLIEAFATARAAVIQARVEATDADLAARLRQVVQSHYMQLTAPGQHTQVTTLPFGAKWAYEAPAEGAPDPCPPCGMARISDTSRVLLDLLTRDEKKSVR